MGEGSSHRDIGMREFACRVHEDVLCRREEELGRSLEEVVKREATLRMRGGGGGGAVGAVADSSCPFRHPYHDSAPL